MTQEMPGQDPFWQQFTQTTPLPQKPSRGKKLAAVGLVVMVLVGLVVGSLLLLNKSENPKSQVLEGQISATDAAPAITATQSFIDALEKNDFEQANRLKSPAAKSLRPLSAEIIQGYFGENPVWSDCKLIEEQNYKADTTKSGDNDHDIIYIEFNCQYADGWPVIITFDIRRETKDSASWLFGFATVRDAGTSSDTI